MHTKTLTQIITPKALKKAFALVSKNTKGLDEVTYELFTNELEENIADIVKRVKNGTYTPEPLSRIYIPKENTTEQRAIGIGALKDKIVQKAIANNLSQYFEPLFVNNSYGYRENKGVIKAIKRVKDYLLRGQIYIYRLDIENFFETISHEQLLSHLSSQIADEKLINLIALFLKNGSFERFRYLEHFEGIHQGDPLSPLLANIYLNQLDWFLQNNNIEFVRFGDDIAIFANSQKEIKYIQNTTSKFLAKLSLMPNPTKSSIYHAIKEGFDFLGINFKANTISITKSKIDQIITKQNTIIKTTHPFTDMIDKLNQHLQGLERYYQHFITPNHPQYKLLQNSILIALSNRVAIERKRGNITTKKVFRSQLTQLNFLGLKQTTQKKDFIERIINRGLEAYLASKKYKKSISKIKNKQKAYAKKYATTSVLYVAERGLFLGVAKNSIVIKQRGKVVHRVPKHLCERVIVASNAISLSSAFVKLCANMGIAVDFIDANNNSSAYASLYGTKNSYAKMSIKQLQILNTPMQLKLAKAFIKGKVKNQINYLKYLNKYHKSIDEPILAMQKQLSKMLTFAKTPNELMGYEGSVSINYWHALSHIIDDKANFSNRITKGATDLVNSALNYGYAILYSRIRYHAVRAGLSINISFLHALDDNKPTLIYDLIEEFRAFVVDRVIFTMINQREPIELDKDYRLTLKSRQLIAKKVLEKIGS